MRVFNLSTILLFFLVTAPGTPLQAEWAANGNPICIALGDQSGPSMVPDGRGGAIIVWYDKRNGNWDIYAQRIDARGALRWATDGAAICTAPDNQGSCVLISDGAEGTIAAWVDKRSDGNGDIYAQRVDRDGNVLWTTDGVAIAVGPTLQDYPNIVPDGSHGAIINWFNWIEGSLYYEFSYYGQKIDSSGCMTWESGGVFAYSVDWPRVLEPVAVSDGAGGAFYAWQKWAYPFGYDYDIWGQHLDSYGTRLWNPEGGEMISYFTDQFFPAMISDGAGGVIVVYQDLLYADEGIDVVVQRFDAQGNKLWNEQGVRIGSTWGLGDRGIVSDGVGGAVITWHQLLDSTHNAQRIDPGGLTVWGALGVDIGTRPAQTMRADGFGGMILAWGDTNITAAKIDGSGEYAWEHSICNSNGIQTNPQIVPDGEGGSLIAWEDRRNGNYDIYAARIDTEGEPPTATLLQSFRVNADHSLVTIEWRLSEIDDSARFFVMRSLEGRGIYENLVDPKIQRNGLSFTCVDASCKRGVRYVYRVDISDREGRRTLFESGEILLPPLGLALSQNYPNPFNPSTTIPYSIPGRTMITVEVYDIAGGRVACLVHEERESGLYEARWDGNDARGNPVSSGVYICRLTAGKRTIARKMVLLK